MSNEAIQNNSDAKKKRPRKADALAKSCAPKKMSQMPDAELAAKLCNPNATMRDIADIQDAIVAAGGLMDYVTNHSALSFAMELCSRVLNEQLQREPLLDPKAAGRYLESRLKCLDYEVFMMVFLDRANSVIATEEIFRGTISECRIYPREVVSSVINHGASSVILAHNHPSGSRSPSNGDKSITKVIIDVLKLIDVRVIDHIIVGAGDPVSMANLGLI